jgi:tetratricopeptide (TPR) repeat protein
MSQAMKNARSLVVGIANYHHINTLPSVVTKDAQDIYDVLIDPAHCGYIPGNVQLLLNDNATRAALVEALADLARNSDEDSTVFIYISSHGGSIVSGDYCGEYLLPVDVVGGSEQSLAETSLSGAEFTAALRLIKARKIVVVFDCCHSGGIGHVKAPAAAFKTGLPEKYYIALQAGRGRVIIASSRDTEVSWVLPGSDNSLFTQYLLAGLRGGAPGRDGLIRIFDLFDYIQPKVTADQPNQHPIFKAELEENFPISLYLGGLLLPSELPPTEQDFVGREAQIKQLLEATKLTKLIGVFGITGTGKTSLLAEVAVRLDSLRVFWYGMKPGLVSLDDFMMQLARFLDRQTEQDGTLASLLRNPGLSDHDKINLVLEQLNRGDYYLFLDAIQVVEDRPEFDSLLSLLKDRLSRGAVFVAGRSKPRFYTPADIAKQRIKIIDLEGLNQPEIVEFFEKKGITPSQDTIEMLSSKFGGLPLALELVAALLTGDVREEELADLFSRVEAQTIDYLFEEVFERLQLSERNLITTAALYTFSFTETDLLNVYKALFNDADALDKFKRLTRQFLIKQVRASLYQLHQAIRTLALKNTDVDITTLRMKMADHLLKNGSEDFGSHLEAALLYCETKAHDLAAKEIIYLVDWASPYFPEIAQALLGRIKTELVSPEERVWLLGSRGNLAHRLRRDQEAEKSYREMLKVAETLHDKTAVAIALQRLGILYTDKNQQTSEEYYLNSLALKKELGDLEGQAEIYNNLGSLYIAVRRFSEADEVLKKGLKIREDIGSAPLEKIPVYSNLGILHAEQGQWGKAENFTRSACEIADAENSPYDMGKLTYNLAKHFHDQGNYDEAKEKYLSALTIGEKYRLWEIKELALTALGMQAGQQANYDEAIESFLKVAEIQQRIGDKARLAVTYFDLGTFHMKKKEYTPALEYYEKGTSLFEHLPTEEKIDTFLKNIYVVAAQSKEPRRMITSLKYLKKRLQVAGPSYALAQVYGTLGLIYQELLKRDRVAYACMKEEIRLLGELERFADQIRAFGGLGTAYEKVEQYGDAIKTLTQAIELAEKQNLTPTVSWLFYNRGNLYSHFESWGEAETDYSRAIEIAGRHNEAEVTASAVHNLAEVYRRQDRPDEAIPLLTSALKSSQEQQDVDHEITTRNNLGLAYQALSQNEKAIDQFNAAFDLSRLHYRKREEARILISLGNYYLADDAPTQARDFFELSLAAAREAEDATMEEASMLSLAYAHRELGTFANISAEFESVAERAGTLKHYEVLISFLTLAGEIDFHDGDIEGSIKMFDHALMLSLTNTIRRFGRLEYDFELLITKSGLTKILIEILVTADRGVQNGALNDVSAFCEGLRKRLEDETTWRWVGRLLSKNYLKPIETYLTEMPNKSLPAYVFGDDVDEG